MKFFKLISLLLTISIFYTSIPVFAQDEFKIGTINLPEFKWGENRAEFEITNNSDWMKYATIETEIAFNGKILSPTRTMHQYYPLYPGETTVVNPSIKVPGNYGSAKLHVRVFDVIDTLDVIMESQKVFEKSFDLNFEIPERAIPYFSNGLQLPPMVINNPVWDNEFAQIIPFLIQEKLNINQIAEIAGTDSVFVKSAFDNLIVSGVLFRNKDGSYKNQFPVFRYDEAKEVKELIDELSVKMSELIKENLTGYDIVLDSMITAGSLTADTNDFSHGGTVLYNRYAVVAGLLLWFDLGQAFISGRTPLEIFHQTNPCHANIGKFMYAVEGDQSYNGNHYYDLKRSSRQWDIRFGDNIPIIECAENFAIKKILREGVDYNYSKESVPDVFIVSANVIRPALNQLSGGSKEIFERIRDRFVEISEKHNHGEVSIAQRYWFWNLFVTHTLNNLVEDKVIEKTGNGQFKFALRE